MDKRTGGPAFPCLDNSGSGIGLQLREPGMTLRDYFAAKVLEGEFASQSADSFNQEKHFDKVARRCYLMADAMLRARLQNDCPQCHGTGDATGQGHLDCGYCDAAEALAEEAKRRAGDGS